MRYTLLILFLTGGCSPYAQVQIDLLQHVQRGLEQTQQSIEQKSQIIAEYHDLRRRQLDQAFDRDVRSRQPLSPEWVIEHRKAYAATLDLLAAARSQNDLAAEQERRNINAMTEALDRVIWLQSIPAQWIKQTQQVQHEQH